MPKRFVSIWLPYLKTDWIIRQQPSLKDIPFVLAQPDHGRMKVAAVSLTARKQGITKDMVVADAKVALPDLHVMDDDPLLTEKLLKKLGHWAIRYTPFVSADEPEGLILDVTGCAHLWGGEEPYLHDMAGKLSGFGYHINCAMADTIGAAWAAARYGKKNQIIEPGKQKEALMNLPPAALRAEPDTLDRLHKLGLHQIKNFIGFGPSILRRRFGEAFVVRLHQALGIEEERVLPLIPIQPFEERLPCMEPIQTRKGIEIALKKLLEGLCNRMRKEGQGIRTVVFRYFRIDHQVMEINVSTNQPSVNTNHLFKLFEIKLGQIAPGLGIELFMLTALRFQKLAPVQQTFWTSNNGLHSDEVGQLLDRIQGKFGKDSVRRFLPAEHHIPERSVKNASSLNDKPALEWRTERRRPIHLLPQPEKVLVTAPIPDYPPMNFKYRGKLHTVKKADGPERIEPEWWLAPGLHRDYYMVEDEEGKRYWLFRAGHYNSERKPEWFLHGIFG